MEPVDYYQVLGVDQQAGPKQIKEAYRALAFKYHPDRNKENPESAEQMKRINEAYAVLSDAQKKRDYDSLRQQYGSSAYNQFRKNYSEQDIFSGSDIHHIFEEMARSFGFRSFDEIFKEFYGPGYRTFEFKKSGFTGGGFVFFGRFGHIDPRQLRLPSGGTLGKLSRYVLKQISGIDMPEKGADINAKDSYGMTSLMMAVYGGHIEIVQTLLKKGAKVNAKNNAGTSIMDIAKYRNQTEIIRILKEAGAQD